MWRRMSSVPSRLLSPEAPCALFVCDVQERFRPLISGFEGVIQTSKFLLDVSEPLGWIPVLTEQYPEKLGSTVEELGLKNRTGVRPLSKMKFSMLLPEVESVLEQHNIRDVLLVGIETHVCVLQTCLDLLERGNIRVHIICDGVSSQRGHDRSVALHRMQSEGAILTTAESAVFQFMRSAEYERFKQVSALVKQRKIVDPTTFGPSAL